MQLVELRVLDKDFVFERDFECIMFCMEIQEYHLTLETIGY